MINNKASGSFMPNISWMSWHKKGEQSEN